jgi:hypothetical protein
MAYMCVTVITTSAGSNLGQAAKKYGVSSEVLRKLKRISTEKGDKTQVRKVTGKTSYTPLTGNERLWIEQVVEVLIRRAGELAYEPTIQFKTLDMSDFPKI